MLALTTLIDAMRQEGIVFERGLAPGELADIEARYEFRFPPDLREFLSIGLPVSDDFPNWRTGRITWRSNSKSISDHLNWPYRGMCFDIENNGFWMRDWEARPEGLQKAFEIARKIVKAAPPLIPVFSHRYLPAEPLAAGNPIISVYQTDIIYYGRDLRTYLTHEFELCDIDHATATEDSRRIRFWSDVIDRIGTEYTSNRFMP